MKKVSLALVLLLLTSGIIAQEETIKQKFIKETRIEAPVFIGQYEPKTATHQTLNQYLQQQLDYLASFDFDGSEGIVSVEFTVETDGHVSNAFITNSVSKTLDQAVLKAIENSSSLWQAGIINGQPSAMEKSVLVKFDIPGNASHNKLASEYLTKAINKVYAVEELQEAPLEATKKHRKSARKARHAENHLVKAERYKPNDLSITFWQAKVYEIQGRHTLMQQELNKYLELVAYRQLEERLINNSDMAVINLK
ncbi:energy transducer TonB [Carboxylicivirga taeanensis]|uniref:energy transducer TonB n=1 Tax=Carboxylicivirga taeanensis TaxID=1416875 RepID=UPI003F6DA6D4